jgi:hypothetical protein
MGDFGIFALVRLVQTLIQYLLLKTLFNWNPSLYTLGIMRLGQAIAGAALWWFSLSFRPQLRRRMGLTIACCERRHADEPLQNQQLSAVVEQETSAGFWADESTRRTFRDGLSAMVVELSVECARTITQYVAARRMGAGAFYQLSAHASLQYLLGLGLAEGAFFQMKLQGAQLLGAGLNEHFAWLVEFVAVFAFLVAVGSVFGTVFSSRALTFRYGTNACVFASQLDCMDEYAGFFGLPTGPEDGQTTMFRTVYTLPFVILIRCIYRVCRSSLYALQDFDYMLKWSLAIFFFAFLPAVVVMAQTSRDALFAVLVMTLPNLLAMVVFGIRLQKHLAMRASGQRAPTGYGRSTTWNIKPLLTPQEVEVNERPRFKPGDEVEYFSVTAGSWVQAYVVAVHPERGHREMYDLDVKPHANASRIRAKFADASPPRPQTQPTTRPPPPRAPRSARPGSGILPPPRAPGVRSTLP